MSHRHIILPQSLPTEEHSRILPGQPMQAMLTGRFACLPDYLPLPDRGAQCLQASPYFVFPRIWHQLSRCYKDPSLSAIPRI
jgi:hypothetical protein